MSDPIKHECGLAVVRLLKPLSHYRAKYGTATWGLDKLQLLMIKQRNRGQDGAGVAVVKFDMPMGEPYIFRKRSARKDAVGALFEEIHRNLSKIVKRRHTDGSDERLKKRFEFIGELYLGHLRYGTYSADGVATCHPYVRHNTAATRSLVLAGNFNLTNADRIFSELIGYGLRPVGVSDTLTVLEKIGHYLDRENDRLLAEIQAESPDLKGEALAREVSRRLDLPEVLRRASRVWDGGYVFAGLTGNGDAFVCRDPNGIRPVFYYTDEEIVAVASERAALTTVFDVELEAVRSIRPGAVLTIRHDGTIGEHQVKEPGELRQCTFERIYFSRGNDKAIYEERKSLGRCLAPRTLEAVNFDLDHTVFSFIPNTAETAFLGLVDEIERIIRRRNADEIWCLSQAGRLTRDDVLRLTNGIPRVEKAAHKDQKVRTFITQDVHRSDLMSHVYDITRGVVSEDDTLVVLDDSIVRGSTLRNSIITMLSRLRPRKIIVLSSAPPIMYPDCYGIDMSELQRFVAFEAAISIRREADEQALIDDIYESCKAQAAAPIGAHVNHVQRLYDGIGLEQLSARIAGIIRPRIIDWEGELQIIYQTIEGLRASLPRHTGDWYFTGNYPTPGGYRVLNNAFINYYENRSGRSYECGCAAT